MAPKRTGKETGSSSGGPSSKRQAPAKNHGIQFKYNNSKIGIKLLSLNLYTLVGTLILIL